MTPSLLPNGRTTTQDDLVETDLSLQAGNPMFREACRRGALFLIQPFPQLQQTRAGQWLWTWATARTLPTEAETREALILCRQVSLALHEGGHLAAYQLFTAGTQVRLTEVRLPGSPGLPPGREAQRTRGASVVSDHAERLPIRTALAVCTAPHLTHPPMVMQWHRHEVILMRAGLSDLDQYDVEDRFDLERRLLRRQGYTWDDRTWDRVIVPDLLRATDDLLHRHHRTLTDVALAAAAMLLAAMWDGRTRVPADELELQMNRVIDRGWGATAQAHPPVRTP